MKIRRALLWVVAPLLALVFSGAVIAVILIVIDKPPVETVTSMWSYGTQANSLVSMLDRAAPLFLSGIAVAIGFKMNLFNIGVEGQYYMGGLIAAWVGGVVNLPAPLHVLLIVLTAMTVGSAWAGIAGVLKVKRRVHEVISTIMLNFIAYGLAAWLFRNFLAEEQQAQDLIINTPPIPPSGQFPNLMFDTEFGQAELFGFVFVAALVGVLYYVLLARTRYGYDLRASGINPGAAMAGGVDSNRMVVQTMLLSGGVAGLVGLTHLLSFAHQYTLDFPRNLGFDGIAVALVGRNNPGGIAVAALLFGFLDRAAQILDLKDIPKEIIQIIQGVIILSVVIAYEVARRVVQAQEVKAAARAVQARSAGDGAAVAS